MSYITVNAPLTWALKSALIFAMGITNYLLHITCNNAIN